MRKLIIIGNQAGDMLRVRKLLKHFYDKDRGDMKKVRNDLVNHVVNNAYVRESNEFIDLLWEEFNKIFVS